MLSWISDASSNRNLKMTTGYVWILSRTRQTKNQSPHRMHERTLGEPSRLRRVAYARNRRVGLRTLHRSSPTRKAREGKVKLSVWIVIACHNQTWRSWVWEMEDNAWSDVWQVWTNMNYKIVQNLMTGTTTCCSSSSSCRWLFTCFAISVSAFSPIYC